MASDGLFCKQVGSMSVIEHKDRDTDNNTHEQSDISYLIWFGWPGRLVINIPDQYLTYSKNSHFCVTVKIINF